MANIDIELILLDLSHCGLLLFEYSKGNSFHKTKIQYALDHINNRYFCIVITDWNPL